MNKNFIKSELFTFRIWQEVLKRLPANNRALFINQAIQEKIDNESVTLPARKLPDENQPADAE